VAQPPLTATTRPRTSHPADADRRSRSAWIVASRDGGSTQV